MENQLDNAAFRWTLCGGRPAGDDSEAFLSNKLGPAHDPDW